MIKKQYTPKRTICKVTFSVPSDKVESGVSIVGDFNEWDPTANPLEKNGEAFETTLRLKPETTYQFRYFVNDEYYENDEDADSYASNEFGSENSVLEIGA
jgi:1,4-alpha-glucan branching enzyme